MENIVVGKQAETRNKRINLVIRKSEMSILKKLARKFRVSRTEMVVRALIDYEQRSKCKTAQ